MWEGTSQCHPAMAGTPALSQVTQSHKTALALISEGALLPAKVNLAQILWRNFAPVGVFSNNIKDSVGLEHSAFTWVPLFESP